MKEGVSGVYEQGISVREMCGVQRRLRRARALDQTIQDTRRDGSG